MSETGNGSTCERCTRLNEIMSVEDPEYDPNTCHWKSEIRSRNTLKAAARAHKNLIQNPGCRNSQIVMLTVLKNAGSVFLGRYLAVMNLELAAMRHDPMTEQDLRLFIGELKLSQGDREP